MKIEENNLWIIDTYGNAHYYSGPLGDDYHNYLCSNANIELKLGLESYNLNTHLDWAIKFNELGMIVVFNSGRKMNNKYYCTIFLPELISDSQNDYLNSIREIFENNYDLTISSVCQYTTTKQTYLSFNDHYIEYKIIMQINKEKGNDIQYMYKIINDKIKQL